MRAVRSLGYRTDIALVRIHGAVEDRGPYIVLKTPSNPGFFWGNFLLFPEPPDARAAERGHAGSWLDAMDRELPGGYAPLFAWDRPDGARGDVDAFLRLGFTVDTSTILTTHSVRRAARHNDDVRVAPLVNDDDWERATVALTNAFAPRRSGAMGELRQFVVAQMRGYRVMQERGLGRWFAAWLDGEVAGSLGLVRQGDLGRFQLVGTDPRFGRRGVCASLVHDVARWGLDAGLETLVMAADAGYHAARVYESVGFVPTEELVALARKPPAA